MLHIISLSADKAEGFVSATSATSYKNQSSFKDNLNE